MTRAEMIDTLIQTRGLEDEWTLKFTALAFQKEAPISDEHLAYIYNGIMTMPAEDE